MLVDQHSDFVTVIIENAPLCKYVLLRGGGVYLGTFEKLFVMVCLMST